MKIPAHIEKTLLRLKEENAFRELRLVNPGLVDFSSNDYLGLGNQGSPENFSFESYQMGATGSRLLTGNHQIHENFEVFAAEFFRGDSSLLFTSGYTANLGLLSTVPSRQDVILYDENVHASIKEGIRLGLARGFSFWHNDLIHLEKQLKRTSGNRFVVVESLYSMDGDFADLEALAEICAEHDAFLIVDEAHSTGLYGENGGGMVVERSLENKVFARLHTFGKAVGSAGAVWIVPKPIRQYLINKSRPFIYSTALPPGQVAHLQSALQQVQSMGAERAHLKMLRESLALGLRRLGLPKIAETGGPILPVIIPGNERVKQASQALQSCGLDIRPILPPSIPMGSERLRIVLHSFNNLEEIQLILAVITANPSLFA